MKRKFIYQETIKKLPDKRKVKMQLIVHPGAALIVPFLGREQLIMLKQYRPAIDDYLYEFPAGTLNPDERPLACARRELSEETGYATRRFTYLGKIYPVPGYATEVIYIYKAEGLHRTQGQKPDEDEVIETHVMSVPEIRKMFEQGKIMDAKTICALVFCGII